MTLQADAIVVRVEVTVAHHGIVAIADIHAVGIVDAHKIDFDIFDQQILALLVDFRPHLGILQGDISDGYILALINPDQ